MSAIKFPPSIEYEFFEIQNLNGIRWKRGKKTGSRRERAAAMGTKGREMEKKENVADVSSRQQAGYGAISVRHGRLNDKSMGSPHMACPCECSFKETALLCILMVQASSFPFFLCFLFLFPYLWSPKLFPFLRQNDNRRYDLDVASFSIKWSSLSLFLIRANLPIIIPINNPQTLS